MPELRDVPDEHVNRPYKMIQAEQEDADRVIGKDYPRPIVDHSEMRERSIKKFEAARE